MKPAVSDRRDTNRAIQWHQRVRDERLQPSIRNPPRKRGKPSGWLQEDFQRIAQRRGTDKARVAVARKLLTLVYYGLRDGEIRCLRDNAAVAA